MKHVAAWHCPVHKRQRQVATASRRRRAPRPTMANLREAHRRVDEARGANKYINLMCALIECFCPDVYENGILKLARADAAKRSPSAPLADAEEPVEWAEVIDAGDADQ